MRVTALLLMNLPHACDERKQSVDGKQQTKMKHSIAVQDKLSMTDNNQNDRQKNMK